VVEGPVPYPNESVMQYVHVRRTSEMEQTGI
jgi:hypothetical protein